MRQSFLRQAIAIVLAVILVVALTLTVMGKLPALWFWFIAAVVFAATYLYKNPK